MVNLDAMHDYNNYFIQHNPSTLEDRFSFDSRMQQKEERDALFEKHFPPGKSREATTRIVINGEEERKMMESGKEEEKEE